MARRFVELSRRGALHQRAGVHDDDLIGQFGEQREIVRDEDHRETELRSKFEQFADDLALRDDVEGRRGLVHDDELGIERERERDHDALALAAREFVGVAVQAVLVQSDHRQQLRGARASFVLGHVLAMRLEDLLELRTRRARRDSGR